MFFKLSLTFLATLGLVAHDVLALPVALQQSSSSLIHLSLKPVPRSHNNIHPQVRLQQRMNRAAKRFARMTGRKAPTKVALRKRLTQRLAVTHQKKKTHQFHGHHSVVSTASASAATGVTSAVPPTTPDSLGLSIDGEDLGYLATVQIGTPPQEYVLLMDSGSADMWVGSDHCKSLQGGGCGNHKFLGTTTSSSFVDTKQAWNITYGTGSVAGTIVNDNVLFGNLVLGNHTFGTAKKESVDFSDNSVPFDGLVGLGLSSLSEQGVPTPPEAMAAAKLIPAAITSYKIPRLADGKNDGEITFGGLDPTKFDPSTLVTLDNVSPMGFWEANMDAVTVGKKQLTQLQNRTAILDTGTTLIIAPDADAKAVHDAIPGSQSDGQGGFTIPCTTTTQVAITFGGVSFAIDSRDLVTDPVDPSQPKGDCVSGISAGSVGGPNEWLLGDVFLKNAYFSHDAGQNRIQLAKLV